MALDPGRLRQMQIAAAQGDPQAQQALAQLAQQGGGAPQGMAPGGPPGGMPPMQGAQPMPGAGGMPPAGDMSQSQFGNGGAPIPPDVQARRAQQLIQMLRARGAQ